MKQRQIQLIDAAIVQLHATDSTSMGYIIPKVRKLVSYLLSTSRRTDGNASGCMYI